MRDKPKASPRFMCPNTPLRISGIRSRAVGDDTVLDPCARQQKQKQNGVAWQTEPQARHAQIDS